MVSAQSRKLSPERFKDAVRKGQIFDVLLLHGEEDYLLREALRGYTEAALPAATADFDRSEFRGSDVDGRTFFNAATTLPLMAKRRLVMLELSTEPAKELAAAIHRYAERPSPTTTLVIVLQTEKERRGPEIRLPGSFVQVDFKHLNDAQRIAWATAYVQRFGKTLPEDAGSYLIENSAKNLADIAAKLDHALAYCGAEGEVTVQTLMIVSGVTSEYTVFNLEDAILARNAQAALKAAQSLIEGGYPVLRLLASHRGALMKLWQVKWLRKESDKTSKIKDIEKREQVLREIHEFEHALFGRQSFKIDAFKKSARTFSSSAIHSAVRGLLEVEIHAKTRRDEPFRYYEWLRTFVTSPRVS